MNNIPNVCEYLMIAISNDDYRIIEIFIDEFGIECMTDKLKRNGNNIINELSMNYDYD
jgi:hypothetical protein